MPNANPTPASRVEPTQKFNYRVVEDASVPLGEAWIKNAQGDTVAVFDLVCGGFKLLEPPLRATATNPKGLLLEQSRHTTWQTRPEFSDASWTPTAPEKVTRAADGVRYPVVHPASPTVRAGGQDVEEARRAVTLFAWGEDVLRDDLPFRAAFARNVDALIAAVRASTLKEVREKVEGMERHRPFIQTTEHGAIPYLAVDDDHPNLCEWINRRWTLAALDALAGETP